MVRASAPALRAWVSWGLVCAVLMAPSVQSISTSGELVAQGSWEISGASLTDFAPIGVYLADTTTLVELTLTASSAEIVHLQQTTARAPIVALAMSVQETRYDVTNATFTLLATPERGWLGVYPEAASAAFETTRLVGESRASAAYGNGATTPEAAPDPRVRAYSVEARGDHLALEAEGRLVLMGDFAVKFQGPDLLVVAAENTTQIETRQMSPRLGTGIAESSWAFLRARDARLEIVASEPIVAPARVAESAWTGMLRVAPQSGALGTPDATYVPEGRTVTLKGAFAGHFAPSVEQTRVRLDGDLIATTLARASAPVSASAGVPGPVLLGIAVVAAAGSTAFALARRQRPRIAADEYARRAAEAARAEDYDAALGWTRKARELAPRSARLATDEGFYLEQRGETGPALAAYERAMALSDDGEPERLAFLLASRLALEDDAARWLVRAIEKAPALVDAIEPARLAPLARRPEVATTLAWARAQR